MSVISAFRRVAAVATLLAIASCGGSPTAPPPPPPPPPPAISITCPTVSDWSSQDGNPVAVTFDAPSATGQGTLTTTCNPASGALFPIGTTSVSCTTTDSLARTANCTFNVRVIGPPKLTYTNFLSFGDSLTQGVESPTPTLLLISPNIAYPTTLETRLRARYRFQSPLPSVINDGIGGEYAATPNPGIGSPGGVNRLRTALPYYRPEVVLLMEGTNDISIFGQAGADDAIAALRTMVQSTKSQGVRVCLATIPPQRPGFRRPNAGLVEPFNVRVRALALEEQVVLVDVYNALIGNLPIYLGVDDLHPTAAGYDKISETFFDAIRATFEQPPPAPADAWLRFR